MTDQTAPAQLESLPVPADGELLFVSLGGIGEIGMNVYLYGTAGKWLMVDCGVSFGTPFTPGIDVLVPNLIALEAVKDRLCGLVITHAHEDHLGAVGYLYDELECPVYATPFVAGMLVDKFRENGLEASEITKVMPMEGRFSVGPFDLELVEMSHSIPEPSAIALHAQQGVVVHTGDWKVDEMPVVGEGVNTDRFGELGSKGVLAVIGDSTNVMSTGSSGSESSVREGLLEVIKPLKGRVAVVCFATNVARLKSLFHVARETGRKVCLVGRSMGRVTRVAKETGYLNDAPQFVEPEHVGLLSDDQVMLICTGSQGEPRAALTRIAQGKHRDIKLSEGDAVVYSSRIIPGNEVEIYRVQNQLASNGVRVITESDGMIHVSGHPGRGEVTDLYKMLKPRVVVPVHGEARHLRSHAALAKELGAERAPILRTGDILRFNENGSAEVVAQVPTGKLGIDGDRFVDIHGEQMRERRKLTQTGVVNVTLALDKKRSLRGKPAIGTTGVLELPDEQDVIDEAQDVAADAFSRMSSSARRDDRDVCEAVRLAVRRYFNKEIGKKPLVAVQVMSI